MSVRVDHKKRRINFIAAWFLFIIFFIGTGQLVHPEAKNVVMFPPTPTSTPSPCLSWDLAADFRVSPDQENPNRDSCNNPNVWQFMVGSGLTHDPLSYSLASYFTPNFNGTVDVNVWSGTSGLSWPFVGYNASSQTQLVSWLAHTINVHPSNNQLVIVAWKSALNGYVSISGGVADADPACGSGIQWTMDRDAVALASGSYVNGGSQTFSNGLNGSVLNMVAVNVNSMLYVIVDPNGDDLCDTTRVDLVINMVNPLTPTQTPTPLPKPSHTPTSCEFGPSPCTRTPTASRTPTKTPTRTPTVSRTPTNTPSGGWGTCWASGSSWASYTVNYEIDASSFPPNITQTDWISSIAAAAQTWNNVSPTLFAFVQQVGSGNFIKYQIPDHTDYVAATIPLPRKGPYVVAITKINPLKNWDVNNTPSSGNPDSNGSTTTYNLQNIVTHELGHWLYLDDMDYYMNSTDCSDVTMYRATAYGEIKKIDLDIPDMNGLNWQYP